MFSRVTTSGSAQLIKTEFSTLKNFTKFQTLISPKISSKNYSSQIDVDQLDSSAKKKTRKPRRRTICDIQDKHAAGTKLTMVTAYDFPTGRFVNQTDIDMVLVGDSLAMVVLGHKDTTSVGMEEMLCLSKAVARGTPLKFLVGDMPMGSYEVSDEQATRNAIQFVKSGMHAVKLEGGQRVVSRIQSIVNAGVNVMGHVGLTPQSAHKVGGFKVQGKSANGVMQIMDDALALQDAGCFSIVLECVPDRVAKFVTNNLEIPTIGIGSGYDTSGQVLVFHDMMGMFDSFSPRFSKEFFNVGKHVVAGLDQFVDEVTSGQFPQQEHSFAVKDDVMEQIYSLAQQRGLKVDNIQDIDDWYDNSNSVSNSNSNSNSAHSSHSPSITQSSSTSSSSTSRLSQRLASARNMSTSPNVVVVGAGSMGLMLSSKLQQTKTIKSQSQSSSALGNGKNANEHHDSSWIALLDPNEDKMSAIANNGGINLHHSDSVIASIPQSIPSQLIKGIQLKTSPFQFQPLSIDILVVLTKSHATQSAIKNLSKFLNPDSGIAITFQNGLGNANTIAKVLSPQCTVQGITSVGACIGDRPGQVTMTGIGQTVIHDLAHDQKRAPIVAQFANWLSDSGIATQLVDTHTIEKSVWTKLIINAAINPLAALRQIPNGDLIDNQEAITIMREIVQEALIAWQHQYDIGNVKPQPLSFDEAWDAVWQVVHRTKLNHSSMTQDLRASRKTEIDVINGAIIAHAPSPSHVPTNVEIVKSVSNYSEFPPIENGGDGWEMGERSVAE